MSNDENSSDSGVRRKWFISLLGLCLPVVIVIGTLVFVGFGLLAGLCRNEIADVTYSPNKELKAVLFGRDCGATTSVSTHLSVMNANDQLPNDGGNVLDIDHGGARVHWISNEKLAVEYSLGSRVFKQESNCVVPGFLSLRKVEIEYSKFE